MKIHRIAAIGYLNRPRYKLNILWYLKNIGETICRAYYCVSPIDKSNSNRKINNKIWKFPDIYKKHIVQEA